MPSCKSCQSKTNIKSGIVRGIQRYKCKDCGLHFVEGDRRNKPETAVKKALCVLLYGMGKGSFCMIAKILGHAPSIIYRWIKEAMDETPEPAIPGDITEIEFDEMWHFIKKKVKKYGSSKPWIVAVGEPLPGLQAVVMLQPSGASTTKSST
jgi:transposase